MTAPRTTTIKVPLPTLAGCMLALAALGTISVVPHLIAAAKADLPPQFMTVHACTVVGLWIAFFWVDTKKRRIETVEDQRPIWGPGPATRNLENDLDGRVSTTNEERALLFEIERRLWIQDEREDREG